MKRWSRGSRLVTLALLGGLTGLPAGGSAFAPTPADLTQALAVAQAGLLNAETRLKAYFPFRAFEMSPKAYKFWGSDPAELLEPPADATLENAVSPSFAVEADGDPTNSNPAPRPLMIGGAVRGYSGVQGPGTHAANGDHYTLRVSDLSGRLYVNDGVDGGPSGSVSQNLKRILNVLGQVLAEPNLGDRILAGRPAGGYARLSDLRSALGSEASYLKVREFLTAHAWVDRNVANPVPLSANTKSRYPVTYYRGTAPIYRFGTSLDASGQPVAPLGLYDTFPAAGAPQPTEIPAVSIFGLDTLNPQWIEIVGRAPVNVNSAPREILIALLADLKGFFLTERKRNNPRWQGDLYLSFKLQNSFAPSGTGGSEYGYLMETYPVVLSGPGVSASMLANEIIACRNRKTSTYVNYAQKPWGGPFRSWHQFNLFVDNLVAVGAITDPRAALHVAYEQDAVDPTGYGGLVPDPTAQEHAAQAIADAIKANFNPNLHLNELNPDENLYLRVDKTDLIVHSTEFSLVPTGYFQVESLGRVVRPSGGEADALAASDNQLMAQAKVSAVLKLYDQYRESTQKQFYGGALAAQSGLPKTNSGSPLEIGPEPDNGVFPGNLGAAGAADNEWDGYVAFATNGGVWHGSPVKAKNTRVTTVSLPPAPQFFSGMHAHFTLDADACDHAIDRREIGGRTLEEEEVVNHPDYVQGVGPLPYGGPYDPTKGNHRLAKSFRIAGGAAPALAPFAPSDLRLDGTYAERHSAPAYFMHQGDNHFWDWNNPTTNARGMVSFWIKPSFFPELTGKIRKFWDMSRYHDSCGQAVNVSPFEMVFVPTNYNTGVSESGTGPKYWHNNMGRFEPCSIYFGAMQWHKDSHYTTGNAHQFGKITTCLNHLGHADHRLLKPSPMRAHRWMNATASWALTGSDLSGNLSKLYINGTAIYSKYSYSTMTGWAEGYNRMNGFDKHCGGAYNHMRAGGTSRIANAATTGAFVSGAYRGNHSSDVTLDELYVWKSDQDAPPDLLWSLGRYYNVRRETGAGGTFTSQAIALPPAPAAQARVLGASWTWYGEETDPSTGSRVLYDYGGNITGTAGADVQPRVSFLLQDGAAIYGPLADDGFSPVLSLTGQAPVLQNPSQVKYLINFGLDAGTATSLLLATPVLDDVTIYWNDGRASSRVDSAAPLVITNPAATALPDAEYGVAYSATFSATGAAPIAWSVDGDLPSGLAIDPATGLLSGSPAQGGTFTFVVTAANASDSAAAQYTLTVNGAPVGGGGGGGGGGCGLLGVEALLLLLALRTLGRRTRPWMVDA